MSLTKKVLGTIGAIGCSSILASQTPAQVIYPSVDKLIRTTPYETITPGVASNWQNNRRMIMTNSGFCQEGKNIFLDRNGHYLDSIKREEFDEEQLTRKEVSDLRSRNQQRIDSWRRNYRAEGNTVAIHPYGGSGYPFAFSCEKENSDFITRGVNSYFGLREEALIQESWELYDIDEPITVREAFAIVEENFPHFSSHTRRLLRGQYVIESGGKRDANSRHAKGIMQIIPYNLDSICGVQKEDWLNELAQIHCAYTLVDRAAQRLEPQFNKQFSHLPPVNKKGCLQTFLHMVITQGQDILEI